MFKTETALYGWVNGDALRVKQILFNLLSNAIKFTHTGEIGLSVRQENANWQFEISDTGIGMTQQQQKSLFAAFYQADASITRPFGGVGIGLAISQELARLMDGEVSVQSELGKGSRFSVCLRLLEATPPDEFTNPIDLEEGLRVLVAEDDDFNQMVIRSLLNHVDIEPVIVNNGQEALDMLQSHIGGFDLVLMDCEMPIMDGMTATKALRAWEQSLGYPRLPVIAITAHVLPHYRQACIEAGMDDFIPKPLQMEDLLAGLERARKTNHTRGE